MKTFYFTASGNSLAVAKAFGGEQISIPSVLKGQQTVFEADKIGIVFPCYVASTPTVVLEFLEKVTLKSDYIFAVMTYGNTSAGALSHFNTACKKSGIKLSYINRISMMDNSLKFFDMDKELTKLPGKKVDEHLSQLVEEIQSGHVQTKVPGLVLSVLSRLGHYMYNREIGDVDKKFSVESTCNECGVCEKVCPVDNITMNGNLPNFQHRCLRCYACTHNCPQNAIRLKGEKSRARYRHPDVKLPELIKANSGQYDHG